MSLVALGGTATSGRALLSSALCSSSSRRGRGNPGIARRSGCVLSDEMMMRFVGVGEEKKAISDDVVATRRRRRTRGAMATTVSGGVSGRRSATTESSGGALSFAERVDDYGAVTVADVGDVVATLMNNNNDDDENKKKKKNVALPLALAASSLAMVAAASVVHPDAAFADVAAAVVEEEESTGGFAQAFLLILLSELGDKTFFISLLLALKEKKSSVFLGTFGALAVMTALSVCIGQFFHVAEGSLGLSESAIPFDDILAVLLLLYFGINTIKGAEDADDVAEEEKEEAKLEIGKMQFSGDQALILSTFALVFAAEWGDKSFFATIALSAAQDPTQVFLGGTAGHGVATGLAVLTGDLIGDYLSEKVVAYAGGALFISFAVGTLIEIFEKLN
jgi:putative Ca2+/H+ antiporter (TMEM165/GDT1 family)